MINANLLLDAEVSYYDTIDDEKIKFVVILAKANSKWVLCKHKGRDSFEIPGGMREIGESVISTAKRELYEETGAIRYSIKPEFVYSTKSKNIYAGEEVFGMVFYADIYEFDATLRYEIDKVFLLDDFPNNMAYSTVQPLIINEFFRRKRLSSQ